MEEAPNALTLAEDLQKALEGLLLNGPNFGTGGGKGRHTRTGSKEVILDEGGVRVEVEDCTGSSDLSHEAEGAQGGGDGWDIEEELQGQGGEGAWKMPSQLSGVSTPTLGMGTGTGLGTPGDGSKARIIPTARPPV